jgi:regulator of nucleoside diphosphate kinase
MSIAVARAKRNPLVTIADAEFDRLDALASPRGAADDPVAGFLAAELDRAIVRPADEIGPNIVRMNSRVAFRIGTRRDTAVRTLVYPEEYARQRARDDCLSVMTPLGAALIGLRVGTGMSYKTGNGATQYVTVEAVLHQPDAVERESAGIEGCGKAAPAVHRGHDPWSDDDPGPAAA